MDISVIKSFSNIKQHEWEELWTVTPNANIYQTWSWYTCWNKHFGNSECLRLILVRHNDNLIGVIPLYIETIYIGLFEKKILTFISSMSDAHPLNQGPLISPNTFGASEDIMEAIANKIINMGGYDIIVFELFDKENPARLLMDKISSHALRRAHYSICASSHIVKLESTYDDFVKTLGSSTRKNIRKVNNKFFSSDNNQIHLARSKDEIDRLIDTLSIQKEERFNNQGVRSSFSDRRFVAFLKDVCAEFLQKERVIGLVANVSGSIAATQLIFVDEHGNSYAYNSSFDPAFSEMRLHYLLESERFKHVISKRCKEMDLSTGYREHKDHWAKGDPRDLFNGIVFMNRVDEFCYYAMKKIKDTIRSFQEKTRSNKLGDQ